MMTFVNVGMCKDSSIRFEIFCTFVAMDMEMKHDNKKNLLQEVCMRFAGVYVSWSVDS